MQVSVIIVSYNVKFFLEQCLAALSKAIGKLESEVWVVDNASSDNSVDYLKTRFSWVNYIENSKNMGFAKANNEALKNCKGDYILFLNPDTLLPEDALIKCINFLNKNPGGGALGIRMIDGSGNFLPESKRAFPSLLTSFYKLIGLSRMFPTSAIFSRYSLGHLDQFKNHQVDVLSGAFLLARKDLLTQLKGFDEDFFMYGEDIDLSYRIQKAGYKNYYFSESTIIHFKGESTQKNSLKYVSVFYKAMSIFVKKHYANRSSYFLAEGITIAIRLRAGVSAALNLFSRGRRFFISIIDGFNAGELKRNVEKRHRILIVGSEEEFKEVKTLLAKAGFGRTIAGRVSTIFKSGGLPCSPTELNKVADTLNVTQIIFCEGEQGYSAIIDIVETLSKKVTIFFHSKGTESIVGSSSKESAGEYIAV